MALFDSRTKFHALSSIHEGFSLLQQFHGIIYFQNLGKTLCFTLILGNSQNSLAETFQRTSA